MCPLVIVPPLQTPVPGLCPEAGEEAAYLSACYRHLLRIWPSRLDRPELWRPEACLMDGQAQGPSFDPE